MKIVNDTLTPIGWFIWKVQVKDYVKISLQFASKKSFSYAYFEQVIPVY